jgi:hypothetical protein
MDEVVKQDNLSDHTPRDAHWLASRKMLTFLRCFLVKLMNAMSAQSRWRFEFKPLHWCVGLHGQKSSV